MQKTIRIGAFRFDESTGELNNVGSPIGNGSTRLPPQPTQLLVLLVESHPELVTRQQIQETLWPGVLADFDRNLHFCVRQIRSAFGDSASSPTYIETIPRRGYRLIADVERSSHRFEPTVNSTIAASGNSIESKEPVPDDGKDKVPVVSTEKNNSQAKFGFSDVNKAQFELRKFVLPAVAALVVVGLVIASISAMNAVNNPASSKSVPNSNRTRLAIMPFVSENKGYASLGSGQIASDLLERLSSEFQTLDVIGPLTTEQYAGKTSPLKDLIAEVKPAWIINGRYTAEDQRLRLLAEIIRAEDGAHVWVKYFDPGTPTAEIATTIANEVLSLTSKE